MNKIKYLILGIFLFLMPLVVDAKEITLYFFHGDGCPHCAEESLGVDLEIPL